MSTSAEITADAVSPIPRTYPIIGSRPSRNLLLGKAISSSITSATQRKSDSRPLRLCFSSGGRTSHSRILDCRSSIFDCTVGACGSITRYRDCLPCHSERQSRNLSLLDAAREPTTLILHQLPETMFRDV